MTILDANGLINCLDQNKPLPESPLIVTEELREEYETARVVNGTRTLNLQDISELPGYNEVYYLKEYARYLNTFSGVDLSCMRGVTDVTILAMVSCILNRFGSGQQTQLDLDSLDNATTTIITNDGTLKRRLIQDYGNMIEIIDPLTL